MITRDPRLGAVAEMEGALVASEALAGLFTQVVHAGKELTVHHQYQIAASLGQEDLTVIIHRERAIRRKERHLHGKPSLHAHAELSLEALFVEPQAIEIQEEPIAHEIPL